LQLRVRERFDQLEKLDMAEGRVPWHVISAAQSIEEVQADIWKVVEKTMEQVKNGKQLGKMWEEGEYQLTSTTDEDSESGKENTGDQQ
jgi:hypothetical protein